VQKRLNRSGARLGADFCGSNHPRMHWMCVHDGTPDPHGKKPLRQVTTRRCGLLPNYSVHLFLPFEKANEMVQLWTVASSGEPILTRIVDSSRPDGYGMLCGCKICLTGCGELSQVSDAVTVGTTLNCIACACQLYVIEQPNVALRPSASVMTDSTEHLDAESTTAKQRPISGGESCSRPPPADV